MRDPAAAMLGVFVFGESLRLGQVARTGGSRGWRCCALQGGGQLRGSFDRVGNAWRNGVRSARAALRKTHRGRSGRAQAWEAGEQANGPVSGRLL